MRARTVHYPITMFIVAVLAVIGVGIGVVAATTSQRLYGPSWGRFTAAFSGVVIGRETLQKENDRFRFRIAATFDYGSLSNGWTGYAPLSNLSNGWTAYAPLSIPRELESVAGINLLGDVGGGAAFSVSAVRFAKALYFHPGATESVQDANGFVATTVGPQCTKGECTEFLVVTNGSVLWEVTTLSRTLSTVETFVSSFQPIG